MKGVLGEGWAHFFGKGGSAYTPTLLSSSDVSCNKKVLHFGMAVRAMSLRTLLPSKLLRKDHPKSFGLPSWLCRCLASSGVLSLPPHQHMRPCTCFAAFLHCPCLRERATAEEPTQVRSSCQGHMLRRKHDPASRRLTPEHLKARTWMAHMQMSV